MCWGRSQIGGYSWAHRHYPTRQGPRQGARDDRTTGESMHGEEVRHSGGCRGRGSSRR